MRPSFQNSFDAVVLQVRLASNRKDSKENLMSEQVSEQVRQAIDEILRKDLEPYGYQRAEIEAREDHSGDPAIFVDALYGRTDLAVDVDVVARITHKLRNRLWELNEERFPYVKHHFDEDRKVAGVS